MRIPGYKWAITPAGKRDGNHISYFFTLTSSVA